MRFDGFWSRVDDLEPEDREYALAEARAALIAADNVMFSPARVAEVVRTSGLSIQTVAEVMRVLKGDGS